MCVCAGLCLTTYHHNALQDGFLDAFMNHLPDKGAYTELFNNMMLF